MRRTLLVLGFALSLGLPAAPTQAQTFSPTPGAEAEQAAPELLARAKAGDARAQNELGEMYENGRGVKQDPAKAAHWYQLAAHQGFAAAQLNLGVLYETG